MTPWQEVAGRIEAGDAAGTLRLVTALDASGRKTVAAELPRHLAEQKRVHAGWWEWRRQIPALRVAGAACLPGPAAVANWLFRRDFGWRDDHVADAGRILGLLRQRPEPWRADLARRMVDRLRAPQVGAEIPHWRIAASLVRETGIEPPANDAFMLGWLRSLGTAAHGLEPAHLERITDDPLFARLMPHAFEADGLGSALFGAQIDVIVRMVDAGILDRPVILDRVVGRLLSDGPSALPTLAELHDRLDPTLDEAEERVTDYVRMLPVAPLVVAETALAQVRRLEAEGRLSDDMFAEAAEELSFRAERKLLLALMGWIGDAVRREPSRAASGLAALSAIFGQDVLPLQERAVRTALGLAGHAGERERSTVREAAAALPAELREKIAAEYGEVVVTPIRPPVPVLVVTAPPVPPPPFSSPEELVRAIGAFRWPLGSEEFERILAGLVEWADREPDTLRSALDPLREVLASHAYCYTPFVEHEKPYALLCRAALMFASVEDSRSRARTSKSRPHPYGERPHPIDQLIRERVREIVTLFEAGERRPVLLATPTSGTGHIAPDTLVTRMELLEAAGVPPLPADFQQALLRLPRSADPDVVARAARLSSPAGRELAAWIERGGLPDPVASCELRYDRRSRDGAPYRELRARIEPPGAGPSDTGLSGTALPDGALPSLIGELFARDPEDRWFYAQILDWWPAVMPSHRDVMAAHMAEILPLFMDESYGQVDALTRVVHGDGPVGVATAYALVVGMGNRNPAQRAAATDALIALAARGDVPTAEIGRAAGELVRDGFVKLNRITSVLDDASRAGAHAVVWDIVAEASRGLLPAAGEKPRANVADLLATGARAAELTGARADIPELAAVVERGGSTRFAMEARRLHRQLTS